MGKRKRRFTYLLNKAQIQLVIEALLMARSSGAHCEVLLTEESGKEHKFEGISFDAGIDELVDNLDASGVDYQIRLLPTGKSYTAYEDKSIEQTINLLNESLGEIEQSEENEIKKKASEALPQLMDDINKFLKDNK